MTVRSLFSLLCIHRNTGSSSNELIVSLMSTLISQILWSILGIETLGILKGGKPEWSENFKQYPMRSI